MLDIHNKREIKRIPCSMSADCISLSENPQLEEILVINFNEKGIRFISKMPFDIGSRQLVKIHDLAQYRSLPHYESIRQVNIVEIRWIKEVTENRGQQFFIGAEYLFSP